MKCKYLPTCSYQANSLYVENVCLRQPDVCLLYRWQENDQDIHRVIFPPKEDEGLVKKIRAMRSKK